MIGTNALNLAMMTALAADATSLAPASDANKVALVTNPWSPTPASVKADVTLASGNGLDPLAGATGAQETAVDPTTGDLVITITEPAGGYNWVSSGSITSPITIYGFVLLDSTLATYLGGQLLSTPIVISAPGQLIDIGNATFRLPSGSLF